jgi:nucleoside-diphosphate-sugar epimerase
MKKVLLTGASGFVGRHCVPLLAAKGYEVHAVSRQRAAAELQGVHWHAVDLLTPGSCTELLNQVQPEYLLHLAWYAEPGKFWQAPENLEWVRASLELLQAFPKNGGKRLVAAGTCAEYEWSGGECKEAATPLLPSTLYGSCKHALEQVLHAWARQSEFSSAWGRIFFLYGPGEHPSRLVAYVIRALLRGEPALCSDGTQIRDFLHVEDVASAFVALLESDVQGAVNIASGKPVAVREVIEQIGQSMGRAELIRFGARPAGTEPAALWANVERLTNEVKWRSRYQLKEGLEQTIDWWRIERMSDIEDGADDQT